METIEANLIEHFQSLGIKVGMNVVVHSRLIALGRFRDAAARIYRTLRQFIGNEATLVVPTYTFNTSVDIPYDPLTIPSTNVGVFSEYVRQLPGAVRSLSPIHNHTAVGPLAGLMRKASPTISLGPGSDFEILRNHGFYLLLLGCRFNKGCTYLHHMEAMLEVPYRRWIELDRVLVHPDTQQKRLLKVRYFARGDEPLTTNFDAVEAP
ncbi:MAG: AAC(3) family N-acetyltransferase, partial [Gammaproteobacteria bacterium]